MQIIGISATNSTMQVLNPILVGKPATAAVTAVQPVAAKAPSAPPANAAPPAQTPQARSSHAHGTPAAGGGGAAAAATAETLISSYSTTVNGTRYSGSVEQSGSEYTASVSGLPGASATGTSAQAAENNLSIRIDELV